MPTEFFQKQPKPNLFKKKTIFHQKKTKERKEPPKRIFRARKVTWWTIFCATFLFPLVLKVVRAVNNASDLTGQQAGMPTYVDTTATGAGVAGAAVAGGVGVVGAAAVGSAGFMALISGTGISAATTISSSFLTSIPSILVGVPILAAIPVIGWIILAILIIVLAILMALSFAGVINCSSCMSGCGGQDSVAGQSPTSQDTSSVQEGTNSQVNNPSGAAG